MASCGSFILPRDSPDSVIRARTAYADERDRSPSCCYYIMHLGLKQTRNWRRTQKRTPSDTLFSRWSSLLVKFHGGQGGKRRFGVEHHSMPQKRKNRIRRIFPDAAMNDSVSACSGQADADHFGGMRNCGIGICVSSYIFIYCAKSR